MRLRRRRLPLAQERRGSRRRLAAARPLRRRRAHCSTSACAPASRTAKRRELVGVPGALSRERARRPSVEGVGGRGRNGQRMPGGQSRWSQGKDLSWEPLRPELVVEVAYDHMQGARFRHTAQFRRWRYRQEAERLHLRAARSRAAAGAWRRSSRPAASLAQLALRAIRASDRRRGRGSPAAGASLRAHGAG